MSSITYHPIGETIPVPFFFGLCNIFCYSKAFFKLLLEIPFVCLTSPGSSLPRIFANCINDGKFMGSLDLGVSLGLISLD